MRDLWCPSPLSLFLSSATFFLTPSFFSFSLYSAHHLLLRLLLRRRRLLFLFFLSFFLFFFSLFSAHHPLFTWSFPSSSFCSLCSFLFFFISDLHICLFLLLRFLPSSAPLFTNFADPLPGSSSPLCVAFQSTASCSAKKERHRETKRRGTGNHWPSTSSLNPGQGPLMAFRSWRKAQT